MVKNAYSDIYKWIDSNGKVHFSDKKSAHQKTESLTLTPGNIIDGQNTEKESLPESYLRDNFRMPHRQSKVPYRFILIANS